MFILFLLLLLLAPAWSFAQDAEEPSLAEVARRERERRASMEQPARIITNANLKDVKGKVSDSTAPSSVGTEGIKQTWLSPEHSRTILAKRNGAASASNPSPSARPGF